MSSETVLKCDLCSTVVKPDRLHTVSITIQPYNAMVATKSVYSSDVCGSCLTQALELNYSWMQLGILHLRRITTKVRTNVRRI